MNPPGSHSPLHDGDVLITPDTRRPRHYTVSQAPGGPQMSWPSREAAEHEALRFARRHAVDVWLDERGTPVRLAANRPSRPPALAHPPAAPAALERAET